MPEIDLSKIENVPISMIVDKDEASCPYETAMKTAEAIGDNVVNFTTIEGVDNWFFTEINPDWFIDLVKSQLQIETVKIKSCNPEGCNEPEDHEDHEDHEENQMEWM